MERETNLIIGQVKDEIKLLLDERRVNAAKTAEQESISASPLNKVRFNRLGEEIQCLRADLMDSYDAILEAKAALDSITFSSIGKRIKDLYLPLHQCEETNRIKLNCSQNDQQSDYVSKDTQDNQFNIFDQDYGGITELQVFFKVCSQLKSYMENVLTQTKRFEELDSKLAQNLNENSIRTALLKQYENKGK